MEVHKPFALGFANCIDAVAYLIKQGQVPKPRLVAQLAGVVPGLDKRCAQTQSTPASSRRSSACPNTQPALSCSPPRLRLILVLFVSWRSATSFYLQNEGKAEYALDAVLAQCEASEAEGGAPAALPQCASDAQWQLLRQQLFSNSEFWPCGPYPMDDEAEDDGGGGADNGDGWVHYDTSNWKPPGGTA